MPLPNGKPTPSDVLGIPLHPVAQEPKPPRDSTGIHPSYSLPPHILSHARGALEDSGRRARRRILGLAAQATYLAVMDPASGSTTKDRLTAAAGAAAVAGLVRDRVDVRVTHALGFKGFQGVEEARVVEVTATQADGAKSG